ncbi:MAG: hypothetical protein VKJ06_03725 [Vampirovibrionales bacterium]|nr:hypothetical protein [Vampirovibrionales bacterium]
MGWQNQIWQRGLVAGLIGLSTWGALSVLAPAPFAGYAYAAEVLPVSSVYAQYWQALAAELKTWHGWLATWQTWQAEPEITPQMYQMTMARVHQLSLSSQRLKKIMPRLPGAQALSSSQTLNQLDAIVQRMQQETISQHESPYSPPFTPPGHPSEQWRADFGVLCTTLKRFELFYQLLGLSSA